MLGGGKTHFRKLSPRFTWEFSDLLEKERWRTTKILERNSYREFWRSVCLGEGINIQSLIVMGELVLGVEKTFSMISGASPWES